MSKRGRPSKYTDMFAVGTEHQTNMRLPYRVIKFENTYNITIRFINTNYEVKAKATRLLSGSVNDKYQPTYFKAGWIGVGKYLTYKQDKAAFSKWLALLAKCYGGEDLSNIWLGEGHEVRRDWLNYQNFCEWLYSHCCPDLTQYYLHFDNDVRIYGPHNCQLRPVGERIRRTRKFLDKTKNS